MKRFRNPSENPSRRCPQRYPGVALGVVGLGVLSRCLTFPWLSLFSLALASAGLSILLVPGIGCVARVLCLQFSPFGLALYPFTLALSPVVPVGP